MKASSLDVASLRDVPFRPQLTEESDLVVSVSVVDVPITTPTHCGYVALVYVIPSGTIDFVLQVQGDDCVAERKHHTDHVHLRALEHTEMSSNPNPTSKCHLDMPSKCVTQPAVLQNPEITAASIMRDIDRELKLQDSDHVDVFRYLPTCIRSPNWVVVGPLWPRRSSPRCGTCWWGRRKFRLRLHWLPSSSVLTIFQCPLFQCTEYLPQRFIFYSLIHFHLSASIFSWQKLLAYNWFSI